MADLASVAAAIAARGTYTDMDILEFLTNVECLEGLFDTYGTFGRGFNGDLEMGGPIPLGAQKANLSYEVQAHMEEVALNEQVSLCLMTIPSSLLSTNCSQSFFRQVQ